MDLYRMFNYRYKFWNKRLIKYEINSNLLIIYYFISIIALI